MKIRTDCKQSTRISGTTPSGWACPHPLEERSPGGRKQQRKIQRTYRVIAVDLLEVLCHGDGEVPRPMERRVHGTMGGNGKSVRGIGLLANVAGAGVLGPELVHRAHQYC